MHIVIAGYFFFPSGMAASNRIFHLCEGLIENGATVSLLPFKQFTYEKEEESLLNYLREKGVSIHFAIENESNLTKIQRGLKSKIAGKNCAKHLEGINRNKKIDAIFLYGDFYLLLNPIIQFARKNQIFSILDIVEYRLKMIPFYEYFKNPLSLDILFGNLLLPKKVDGICCITKALVNKYKEHNPMLLPAVEDWSIEPKYNDTIDSNFKIVYVGTLSRRDNPRIIEALASKLSLSNVEISIQIVGNINSLEGKKIANDLLSKFPNVISVIGKVTNAEMSTLFSEASAFLLPRLNEIPEIYAFPTRIVEYLKTGKLVITQPVGDLELYLKDKKNGLLLVENQIDEIVVFLEECTQDFTKYRKIGNAGFETGRINFDRVKETARLIEYIHKIGFPKK